MNNFTRIKSSFIYNGWIVLCSTGLVSCNFTKKIKNNSTKLVEFSQFAFNKYDLLQ